MITVLSICTTGEIFARVQISNTHVWFGSAQLELNETNLGLFHPCWTPSRDDDVLVQDDTLHELSVFNSSADLFDNTDISQIDIRGGLSDKTTDGLDGDWGKSRGILRDDLRITLARIDGS
jgi:hypothetical protein